MQTNQQSFNIIVVLHPVTYFTQYLAQWADFSLSWKFHYFESCAWERNTKL